MKLLQSPTPNRKGVREVHYVPLRKVDGLLARGWTEVKPERPANVPGPRPSKPAPEGGALTGDLNRRATFDLSGSWFRVRAEVRDALGHDRVPSSKDEARVLLEDAGYEVTGA